MGLTHVVVKLRNSDSAEKYEANFLVDTGALLSMAPASELKKLGIKPLGKELYELANGDLQEYEHGEAKLSFMNEVVTTRILFGPEDIEPILGVVALETAGYLVDPSSQKLRKPRALPLK